MKRNCFSTKVDYFKVMGVDRNSSTLDIKKRYIELTKKYHPDINVKNQDFYRLINEAYSILSNETKKEKHLIELTESRNWQENNNSMHSRYKERSDQEWREVRQRNMKETDFSKQRGIRERYSQRSYQGSDEWKDNFEKEYREREQAWREWRAR